MVRDVVLSICGLNKASHRTRCRTIQILISKFIWQTYLICRIAFRSPLKEWNGLLFQKPVI